MIACRYMSALARIQVHALAAEPDGPRLKRQSDSARGWRCSLKAHGNGGARMDYWERPDGVIEFTAIAHDDQARERPRGRR
jgi:hypothetical protein